MGRRMKWWGYALSALGLVVLIVGAWVGAAALVYGPTYVGRVLVHRDSEVEDYLHTFPLRPLRASPEPFTFGRDPADEAVRAALEEALNTTDLDSFFADSETQAFLVIEDDEIIYESYHNGTERDFLVTSFSVAKSFDSALIGIAIDEGFIGSVDDPITTYLPELSQRDERFDEITIRHLLRMASGLDFQEMRWALFNGDDPLTTYYPDQRELALEHPQIAEPPGEHFRYNKLHPQLMGMILERATGMSVTEFTQSRLWDPLGMEYDGAWALDSTESGFEKMEAGLNARAVDFAKLGRLYLEDGNWNGVQVVPAAWVKASISPDPSTHNPDYYSSDFGQDIYAGGDGWYGYMWYGRQRENAPADFFAEGDRGQFIYVSPAKNMVIVRNGLDYGISSTEWIEAFYEFAGLL